MRKYTLLVSLAARFAFRTRRPLFPVLEALLEKKRKKKFFPVRSGSFTNELLGLSVRARHRSLAVLSQFETRGESRDLLRVTHLTAKTAGRLEYGKLYGLEGEPSCRHRVGRRIPGAVCCRPGPAKKDQDQDPGGGAVVTTWFH